MKIIDIVTNEYCEEWHDDWYFGVDEDMLTVRVNLVRMEYSVRFVEQWGEWKSLTDEEIKALSKRVIREKLKRMSVEDS